MASESSKEVYQFQAEINELLSLIINTFYTNSDVFLRELISNASDANNKARHLFLKEPESRIGREHHVRIHTTGTPDDSPVLIVEDNGVGMSKDDLVNNLGTIASSGTKNFAMSMPDGGGDGGGLQDLIGQFGVGFYSAYLVAEEVHVFTRKDEPDSVPYKWSSTASGSFEIEPVSDDQMPTCGTRVELRLKNTALKYLEETTLKEIVGKHSGFLGYPVQLLTRTQKPVEDEDEDEVEKEEGHVEEVEDASPKEPKMVDVEEWTTLNTTQPIWKRDGDDVPAEEYAAFYKSISNDWEDPLVHRRFVAEGQIEFKSLLFIPRRAPFDMFKKSDDTGRVKLYVRGVLVTDKNEEMLPDWLTFVRGIVDSDDLPLNVSRETMQQNTAMKVIRKNIVKRAIEMVEALAESEDQTDFNTFYDSFHQSIKLGVHDDSSNKTRLTQLLRFQHAKGGDKISLKQYVESSTDDNIYYLSGASRDFLANSPFTKGVLEQGHDVLFMVDPIDEYVCQQLRDFEGKTMVDISKDNTIFQVVDDECGDICKHIMDTLGAELEKVVVSSRLGDVPCCIVSTKYGWGANMERVMKSQSLSTNQQFGSSQKRVMEINPSHPLIKLLRANKDVVHIKSTIRVMYDVALINSGYMHDDPSAFTGRMFNMLRAGMGDDLEDHAGADAGADHAGADVGADVGADAGADHAGADVGADAGADHAGAENMEQVD